MPSPIADARALVVQQTMNTLVLEALLACLRAKGTLTSADLAGIEGYALAFARRVRDRSAVGAREPGERLEQDVRAFFATVDDIETYVETRGDAGRC